MAFRILDHRIAYAATQLGYIAYAATQDILLMRPLRVYCLCGHSGYIAYIYEATRGIYIKGGHATFVGNWKISIFIGIFIEILNYTLINGEKA